MERNLSGFRFTPAMTLPERLQVEELLCGALATLPDAGDYVALSSTATEALRSERLLFEAPDAPWILASGRARHWPQARGVFRSKSKD